MSEEERTVMVSYTGSTAPMYPGGHARFPHSALSSLSTDAPGCSTLKLLVTAGDAGYLTTTVGNESVAKVALEDMLVGGVKLPAHLLEMMGAGVTAELQPVEGVPASSIVIKGIQNFGGLQALCATFHQSASHKKSSHVEVVKSSLTCDLHMSAYPHDVTDVLRLHVLGRAIYAWLAGGVVSYLTEHLGPMNRTGPFVQQLLWTEAYTGEETAHGIVWDNPTYESVMGAVASMSEAPIPPTPSSADDPEGKSFLSRPSIRKLINRAVMAPLPMSTLTREQLTALGLEEEGVLELALATARFPKAGAPLVDLNDLLPLTPFLTLVDAPSDATDYYETEESYLVGTGCVYFTVPPAEGSDHARTACCEFRVECFKNGRGFALSYTNPVDTSAEWVTETYDDTSDLYADDVADERGGYFEVGNFFQCKFEAGMEGAIACSPYDFTAFAKETMRMMAQVAAALRRTVPGVVRASELASLYTVVKTHRGAEGTRASAKKTREVQAAQRRVDALSFVLHHWMGADVVNAPGGLSSAVQRLCASTLRPDASEVGALDCQVAADEYWRRLPAVTPIPYTSEPWVLPILV